MQVVNEIAGKKIGLKFTIQGFSSERADKKSMVRAIEKAKNDDHWLIVWVLSDDLLFS